MENACIPAPNQNISGDFKIHQIPPVCMGNNPMVGATVSVAVAVGEAVKS